MHLQIYMQTVFDQIDSFLSISSEDGWQSLDLRTENFFW